MKIFHKVKEKLLPSNTQKSWSAAIDHSFRMTLMLLLALVIIFMLVAKVLMTKPVTVVTPPNLSEPITIIGNQADEPFKKLWGTHIASMLGNANERNLEVILDSMKSMLTVRDYDIMAEQLSTHVKALALRNQRQSFNPQDFYYDPKSDIVYIYGERELTSRKKVQSNNPLKPVRWTYEITVKYAGGRPHLAYIDQYEGAPRIDKNRIERVSKL
ncbi:TraE/TraK family type IV conjugative transfer system protein [Vibrio owensii]|uniref:TraE/TraK family type IV conjugative transfer system protein n=1 Tax=Vibrio owensii TaxID=696485 RepID=UPI00406768EF